MKREIIIILAIIGVIAIFNIITQTYTKNIIDSLTYKLDELKVACLEKNKEDADNKEKEIKEDWNNRKYWLAYYIEHDELEKVETRISLIKGNTEAEEFEETIPNIEDTKFILKHIQEKYIFILQNIF